MSETVINSKGYWNERFGDDWEDLGGREQSRFFGAVALQMLPAWLVQASNRQQLSWCDWGCALGDGTNEIAQGMPGTTFTGVDFSAVAIADAAERFPGQQFISEDWLAPGATPAVNRFDVLFSSNTLEHFHTPWDVLATIAPQARHCIVLMLPYRERHRIEEHHASFMPDNIPQQIGGKVLVHAQVRDTRHDHPCFWPGEQIMLVWADPAWLAAEGLHLSDLMLDQEPGSPLESLSTSAVALAHALSNGLATVRSHVPADPSQVAMLDQIRTDLDRWQMIRDATAGSTGPAWSEDQQARDRRDAELLGQALAALAPLLTGSALLDRLHVAVEDLSSRQDALHQATLSESERRERDQDRQQKSLAEIDIVRRQAEQALAEADAIRQQAAESRAQADHSLGTTLRLGEEIVALLGPSVGSHLDAISGKADASQDVQLQRLRMRLLAMDQELNKVYSSTSWRVTTPIRVVRRLLSSPKQELRNLLGRAPRPVQGAARFGLRTLRTGRVDPSDKARLIELMWPSPQVNVTDPLAAVDYSHLPPLAALDEQGTDVFIWSVIDWNFRTQRPQHLAMALAAKGHRVFYVSNNFVDAGQPGFKVDALDDSGRLFQIHLNLSGAPQIYHAMPDQDQVAAITASLASLLGWTRSIRCMSFVQHPYWLEPAQSLPNAKLVYDCMDHHGGFEDNAEGILGGERSLIQQADLLVVTSQWLHDELSPQAKNIAMVRNATEYAHFCTRPQKVFSDAKGRRIIGYYGAIAEWFDVELLRRIALDNPEALVLMIGRDTANVSSQVGDIANIRFVGEVPYAELPYWLHAFDVCLLPFKVIPLTLATNPVKVYEYLSAGKAVVSVDLPELSQFEGLVRLADDHDGFLAEVKQALAEDRDDPSLREPRQAFASRQTWQHRAETLDQALSSIDEPLISIVVLTYNNLDYTRQCLHSLETYTDYDNVEVIVVDNASSDESPAFLAAWAEAGPRRRFIANDANLGFSAGNNVGLRVAKGEYLVMLNNDTYVTPGWLRTLRNQIRRHPQAGLVGPVTNNIGNEAKIDIAYDTMEEMVERAGVYTRAHAGQSFPVQTSAFFCVMISRQAYELVGGLDEQFGVGFFEDDDYCRRLEQNGLQRLCVEDAFVHHQLSASFNKLKAEVKQKLFEQNKALYEAKWGPWTPHGYRARR